MNIINQLKFFDTAELSDAMDACNIEGALFGIKSLLAGAKMIGPAFTVKYLPYKEKITEFKNAGNYIDNVEKNAVIVIDNGGLEDCTVWGGILTGVAINRHIAGTVVNGAVRDIQGISKTGYPLYARSIYMRSGKNRVYKTKQQGKVSINNVEIHPGDIIVGDDNGVIAIPLKSINKIITKAKNIKNTEIAILESIRSGMTLEKARSLHRYDQPWLNQEDKKNDFLF